MGRQRVELLGVQSTLPKQTIKGQAKAMLPDDSASECFKLCGMIGDDDARHLRQQYATHHA